MSLTEKLQGAIREVADFPKPGIIFKDITPLLQDPAICSEIVQALARPFVGSEVQAVAGIESRGFLFGFLLAQYLKVPFVPIRKEGKLPWLAHRQSYDLEYGSAVIEMHRDALTPGQRVVIHDDLLATGGTALAASRLIEDAGGVVLGYSFLVELGFLPGPQLIKNSGIPLHSLVQYKG
jgi:adenine phosphoribosyltransferase